MDRRAFMNKTGLGLLSTGVGIPLLGAPAASPRLVHRTLGRTGLRIPVVSFGVMNTYSGDLIRRAVDAGIKHFDTAHLYLNGNSERSIGRVLEETGKRKDVYVATKMRFARDRERNVFISEGNEREPAATEANLYNQLDVSLNRLRTDYVDILYIHSCYSPEMATFEPLVKAMVKAKETGKARFIGVSTHRNVPEVIRAAADTGIYDVIEVAYNYLDKRRDAIRAANRYAAERGVGIVAMKVMGGNDLNQDEKVQINHRAALKWVLSDENVTTAIPGMTNFDQLDLNLSVMSDLTLTEDEMRELKIASMLRGTLYCQNCRSCIPTCPHRVEVPNLMRAFMYAEGYGNAVQAAMTVVELPIDRGIEVCRSCERCTTVCPNGIPVGRRVRSLLAEGYSGRRPV
jgi:predicted aldo/keto reductase-like oxidoreductase